MTKNTITNQAIALAGISQAAAIVQQLATTGKAETDAFEANIKSLFTSDEEGIANVFGGLEGVRLGLNQLNQQLTGYNIDNPEQARYAASLVFLEKQLSGKPEMMHTIFKGIERAKNQSEHFGMFHENVLANLGDIYHTTISTLQPRIMVNGEQEYLANPDIVNKIRAVLLSGIRCAILWKHCGGKRWKFLFFRKKLQDEVLALLNQI